MFLQEDMNGILILDVCLLLTLGWLMRWV